MKEIYVLNEAGDFKIDSEVPRREFDLVEFYKKVKKTHYIYAIEIDEEAHIISFLGTKTSSKG